MIPGLALGFAQPLVLLGLLGLPVLWWLLRLIPPRPHRVRFAPTRLLFEIAPKEETPSRTPWWLTLLRLVLAALVILAAAGPMWNPGAAQSGGSAPIALLIDDGWTAASTWDARVRTANDIIARAESDNRGVAIIPLSEPIRDVSIETAGAARVRVQHMQPKPYGVERADALPMISRLVNATPNLSLIWLSDGVDLGKGQDFVNGLAGALGNREITIVTGGVAPAHALAEAENAAGALTVKVIRATAGAQESSVVRGLDLKGLPLGDAPFTLKATDTQTTAQFDLPVEIRNDMARLEIVSERSAGAVQLLDKRWRRRAVGIISGASADTAQPLLAPTYYLTRALNPFADVRQADATGPAQAIGHFVDQNLSMIILADVGNLPGNASAKLIKWVEDGGVLVRFAGPRLAAMTTDDLLPVTLRRGDRTLGGSLSWDQPQALTGFPANGPFAGMPIPDDVTVNRQVLAEPNAELIDRTWATLADGTPLVTGEKRGKGMVVLFHVTADTRWSNLPLSGAFVDMLKRVVALSGTHETATDKSKQTSENAQEVVPPTRILDGFGAFGPPPPNARPIATDYAAHATAEHPPGFYGPPEGLVAVNTLTRNDTLAPLDVSALKGPRQPYQAGEPQDLRGPVLAAALALLLLDAIIVFWLAGGIARLANRRRPASAIIAIGILSAALLLTLTPAAMAQSPRPVQPPKATQTPQSTQQTAAETQFAMKATEQTHLAYVVTGDAEVDRVTKAGLEGLTMFLAQRTALEAGDPIAVDPAHDELAFFPLIYWPIVPSAQRPTQQALDKIDAFMKQGGTVLFDTRDAGEAPPGPGGDTQGPGMVALRSILSSLDIPELEPVPRDHVLTKTFFLLKDFPGRFDNGQLWVEALPPANDEQAAERPARAGDGVSSIIITSNDLAGAWAIRSDGQAMLPLSPGEPRQREYAFRAGVNIVMYTLTGNYKADQVHVPALLERLGQ
jgi:hypothetical protein